MATANRAKLHKHFIRGRDPMAPIGDGAPNLLQQVKTGRRGSREEGGERWGSAGDNTAGLWEDGRAERKRERIHCSAPSAFHSGSLLFCDFCGFLQFCLSVFLLLAESKKNVKQEEEKEVRKPLFKSSLVSSIKNKIKWLNGDQHFQMCVYVCVKSSEWFRCEHRWVRNWTAGMLLVKVFNFQQWLNPQGKLKGEKIKNYLFIYLFSQQKLWEIWHVVLLCNKLNILGFILG